jgi:hypothetical protein
MIRQTRPVVARPATATDQACIALEARLVAHYEPILNPQMLITARKGCYATVINSTISGMSLENTVGTAIAKEMTEAVLDKLTASISTIE